MSFNPKYIDNDNSQHFHQSNKDEEYKDYSDIYDIDEEECNEQHEKDCRTCAATGEGMYSGSSCSTCKGKGYIIVKH